MFEKYGRGFGAAIAVLLAVCCLFIGKVVAVDSPHSPVGLLIRFAQSGQEPTEPLPASPDLPTPLIDAERRAGGDLQEPVAGQGAQPVQDAVPGPQLEGGVPELHAQLSRDGGLTGRIHVFDPISGVTRPAERMTIALLQGGRVVSEFRPQANGEFTVRGLSAGPYSLVGYGQDGYVAMGVELHGGLSTRMRDTSEPDTVAHQVVQSDLDVESLVVPLIDTPVVMNIARRHLSPDLFMSDGIVGTDQGSDEETDSGTEEATELAEPDEHVDDVVAVEVRPNEVRLAGDGSLSGRIRSMDAPAGQPLASRNLSVFLVKNREIVGSAPVSPEGDFTFGGITPGVYTFVVAGTNGFAAFSIRAVAGAIATSDTSEELHVPVALLQADFAGVIGTLVMAEDVGFAVSQLAAVAGGAGAAGPFGAAGAAPFGPAGGGGPGGFGGGGFGGGGGGGLGLGGLGGVLGLAGLAAGIAALASDNNNNPPRVIATPF